MRRIVRRSLIPAVALALLPALAATASPSVSPPYPDPPVVQVPANESPTDIEDYLTLPAISAEQAEWMTEVQDRLGSDPAFTSLEISQDRQSITVTWYGAPSSDLNDLLAAAPADSDVLVAPSNFPGGELRELLATAVQQEEFGGVRVVSGFVNTDGSGITLDVVQGKTGSQRARADISSQLGSGAVPIAINTVPGEVQPFYSRYDDPYHLGGGAIVNANTGAQCSTGFAVQRNGSTQKGMMFASHCGDVGQNWARPSPSAQYGYYSYGSTVQEVDAYDGAIIEAPNNHFQPYVWTTTWDSADAFLPVKSTISPGVGVEICYSGAYTGLSCGSVVNNTTATWSLNGVPGIISGVLTVRTGGGTAAGQGDSGGAGVVVVANSTGWSLQAATIVSGGPPTAPSTTCAGRPVTRQCGPSVYAGRVNDIAGAAGVTIQTVP